MFHQTTLRTLPFEDGALELLLCLEELVAPPQAASSAAQEATAKAGFAIPRDLKRHCARSRLDALPINSIEYNFLRMPVSKKDDQNVR